MKQINVVTGSSGFIGKELVSQLRLKPDIKVYEISNSKTGYSNQDSTKVDLNNLESVMAFMSQVRPDKIFHLASKSSVVDSWHSPAETIFYNHEITKNIVEAIKQTSPNTRLIHFSSSAVYARSQEAIQEVDHLGPDSPYGISKLMGEMEVQTLENHLILRPFFVIGPGKKGDVLDDWFSQAAKFKSQVEIELNVGNIDTVRDFISCVDATRLIIELENKIQKSEIYNICTGRETILKDLLEKFLEIVGPIKSLEINTAHKSRLRDRPYVVGNASKLREAHIEIPNLNIDTLLKEMYLQRSPRI
jgi:GDP-4-dehydro-6-deoxy-D-mannose reductase